MGDGALHGGVVDTVAAYRCTLESFENAGPLDLVVLSGDVSDDGSPASYRILRSLTGDFAARHGAVAVYAMGNHDQRTGFRAVLGSGHPGTGADSSTAAGLDVAAGLYAANGVDAATGLDAAAQTPLFGVSEVAGYRIITVDSSVPGRTHGQVDAAQLEWLRAELATDSGHGTVVVIHHPPVEPVTALHQGIELINPDELADALAGSDTVAILSGHYHHHMTDVFAAGSGTIPVVVTSGVVNSNDVLAPAGHERAGAGSGGTLVTLSPLPGGALARQRPAARVRTLPVRIHLPPEVSPELVFDLAPPAVAGISAAIAVAPAELLGAGRPAPPAPQPPGPALTEQAIKGQALKDS